MASESLSEHVPKQYDEKLTKEDYIQIEVPSNLYQYLSSEESNVQNVCRICLSTENEVLYPLLHTEQNTVLQHMFTSFTTVQISADDGLPASICETCQNQVVQCYEFKMKCERSDCMLKTILKGEFFVKNEPPDPTEILKQEEKGDLEFRTGNINVNNNIHVKEEIEFIEDVQYLEDLSDDEALCIIQNTGKSRKKVFFSYNEDTMPLSNLKANGPKRKRKGVKQKNKKTGKSFSCNMCDKVFTKAKAFHAHISSSHPNLMQPHSCGQCRDSFNSEHDLKVHTAIHSNGKPWKCNKCLKEFDVRSRLRRHISRHMESKRYSCEACGKTFTELYALRRHTRVHTGERVEKKHACTICDKRYSESGLLAAHMSRHIGLRPCECNTCGKRFSTKRLLASHQIVHSDHKPYACHYCDKRFRHESTRNTHHRTHTGEKPYICSVCGKNFIQNSNLTLHMRTHTGERPYSCNICERKFSSISSLKNHERVHTGEKSSVCTYCNRSFSQKSLKVHMMNHTGERPFECNACDKKFTKASRLRDHQRIHTGEKPYDCSTCSQKFTTRAQMIKHLKSHEKLHKKQNERTTNKNPTQEVPDPENGDNRNENDHLIIMKYDENVNGITEPIVEQEISTDESTEINKELALNILQEVPLEVSGELVLQEDNNMKAELLVVDNSQNNIQGEMLNSNLNYASDMNLVAVNEGEVSISTSNLSLEGTTVKLYQLDQSLLQIHSSGGQVTISKITSKMTANF